jgi:hypothetical protein
LQLLQRAQFDCIAECALQALAGQVKQVHMLCSVAVDSQPLAVVRAWLPS